VGATLELPVIDMPQTLLTQLTDNVWVAALVVLSAIIIGLAAIADALKKLYDTGKAAWAEFRRSRSPGSEFEQDFDTLRRNVLFCGITSNISVELGKLRTFLVEKGLVEKPEFRQFFDRWLSSPFVSLGVPVNNALTYEQIRQMEQELRDLQLKL
jgi:hypothetical protein